MSLIEFISKMYRVFRLPKDISSVYWDWLIERGYQPRGYISGVEDHYETIHRFLREINEEQNLHWDIPGLPNNNPESILWHYKATP